MFRNAAFGLLVWYLLSAGNPAWAITDEERCLLVLAEMASSEMTNMDLLLGAHAHKYDGVLKASGWTESEVEALMPLL